MNRFNRLLNYGHKIQWVHELILSPYTAAAAAAAAKLLHRNSSGWQDVAFGI